MKDEMLIKTLLLSISFMGVFVFLSGIILLYFKAYAGHFLHYLLPVPPIAVASYVFVFNFLLRHNGHFPQDAKVVCVELLLATAISASVFLLCSALILAAVRLINHL